MNPAVLEQQALMRAEAAARPRAVRHLWIYLTERECRALSRGLVSGRLRREFDRLLNGWKGPRRRRGAR